MIEQQIKAHIWLDDNLIGKPLLWHAPRLGETIRFAGERYGKVYEVCWVLDEPESPMQRVNIGCSSLEAVSEQS